MAIADLTLADFNKWQAIHTATQGQTRASIDAIITENFRTKDT